MAARKTPRIEIKRGKLILGESLRQAIEKRWNGNPGNPKKFKADYERRRIHLQTKFGRLVDKLKEANIEVSVNLVPEKTRTGNSDSARFGISGFRITGDVNWMQAKSIVGNSGKRIRTLIAELRHFWKASNGKIGHRVPEDILSSFAAIEQFVLAEGNTVGRTWKKRAR
ncbi:MAG: hypothetical protein HY392_02440 [Candidatus Diapherotrites archaeon]|nr:hypothetical protein [Candidatus Diapherotrites archaeon]